MIDLVAFVDVEMPLLNYKEGMENSQVKRIGTQGRDYLLKIQRIQNEYSKVHRLKFYLDKSFFFFFGQNGINT